MAEIVDKEKIEVSWVGTVHWIIYHRAGVILQ
jgi:hypothetical protein